MKRIAIALTALSCFAIAAPAAANEAMAKADGCLNCHAVDAKKVGPSFKDIAAKYKGKADAEAKLVAEITAGKDHPKTKASADDVKTLVKWVLAQ